MAFRRPHPRRPARTAGLAPSSTAPVRGHASPAFKAKLLALAIGCALAGLAGVAVLAPSPALAAESAASAAGRDYAIPAGRLSDVLARFAATAGVQLVFDPQMLAGLNSNGLQGRYSVREGFDRLLAGSGYELVDAGNGDYSLRPKPATPAERGAVALPIVTVTEAVLSDEVTEGSGSYITKVTRDATKLKLSPRETPQSVTVMTRQRMDDQNLVTVGKVLEQATGITPGREGNDGTGYSYYRSRGFQVTNFQIDGIITSSQIMQGFGNGSAVNLDSALYDHIGVVRGATGLLTGAGDPGGSINLVRKKPTADFQAHVLGSAGSWDRYRTEVDVAGPLTKEGNVRGRLVGAFEDGRSWQDRLHSERSVAYGVLEVDLTDRTLLTAGFDVYNSHADDAGYCGFQLSDTAGNKTSFSRSRNAAANWSYEDMERQSLFASLQHRFNNGWQATLALNHVSTDNRGDRASAQWWIAPGGASSISAQRFIYTPKQVAVDLYASGPYQLFGREHELMFGLNYFDTERDDPYYDRVLLPIADVHAFDGNIAKPNFVQNGGWYQSTRSMGQFLATRLRPTDALSVILGARRSDYENEDGYSAWGGQSKKESGVVTPYVGVVYDLDKQLSVYASYTSIFNPQSQGTQDVTGKTLDPETGNSNELGLKGEFVDGRLNASVAVFAMQKENVARTDGPNLTPGGNQAYVAANGVKAKGFELEVSGAVRPDWNISGSYSLLSMRDDSGRWDGTGDLPRHQFKAFTTYKLPGAWNKLTVGGGITWQSTTRNDQVDNWQPGTGQNYVRDSYSVVNLMARYQATKQLDLLLNLENLLDEKYLMGSWHHTYGAPRNLTLTAKYRF